MFGLSLRHLSLIGGFFVALGAFVGAQPDWSAFTTPLGIGGLLGVVGAFLGGLYSEKPSNGAS